MDSTEKYDGISWVEVTTAAFPYKIDGLRAVSINNNIFITGSKTCQVLVWLVFKSLTKLLKVIAELIRYKLHANTIHSISSSLNFQVVMMPITALQKYFFTTKILTHGGIMEFLRTKGHIMQ